MATLSTEHNFTIHWEDVDTAQTLEREFRADIERITIQRNSEAIWVRQSGEEVLIRNMNSEHIINSLRMCKRNLNDPMAVLKRYEYLLLEAIHRNLMNRDVGEWDSEENNI